MIRLAAGVALIWASVSLQAPKTLALPPGLYLPARATDVSHRTRKSGVAYS